MTIRSEDGYSEASHLSEVGARSNDKASAADYRASARKHHKRERASRKSKFVLFFHLLHLMSGSGYQSERERELHGAHSGWLIAISSDHVWR